MIWQICLWKWSFQLTENENNVSWLPISQWFKVLVNMSQISKNGRIEFYLCCHGSRETCNLVSSQIAHHIINHTGAVLYTGIYFFNDLNDIVPKHSFCLGLLALWKYLKYPWLRKCLKCVWNTRMALWRNNVEVIQLHHQKLSNYQLSHFFVCLRDLCSWQVWPLLKCSFQQQRSQVILEISLLLTISS